MKTYIQIDQNNYFVGFKKIRGDEPLEGILKSWDRSGGSAAQGFEIDVSEVSKVPSDCIDAQPPIIRVGYIPKWTGNDWFYESEINFPKTPKTGDQYTIGGVVYTWDGDDWGGQIAS